jgi:PAS domain S-box-containing protein
MSKVQVADLSAYSVMDASPECVKIINSQGTVEYINRAGLDLIEVPTVDIVVGASVFDFIPLEYQDSWKSNHAVVCSGKPMVWQYEVVGQKGTRRYLETYATPLVLSTGECVQFALTKDITQYKIAERSAKEKEAKLELISEQRFKTLANTIPNMAWMAHANGDVYWYNDRWMEYSGLTMEEMTGWGWSKLHHPDHIDRLTEFVKEAWLKNEPFEVTHPMRGKDGLYKWFLSRATPILDKQGNILEWIGTLTDIDEQKNSAELLEQQVKIRTSELDESNKSLQKSNEQLAQFAHVASHDLKEPLRKVRLYLSRINDELGTNANDNVPAYLSKIEEATLRMTNLIEGILRLSTVNNEEHSKSQVNLNKTLEGVLADLEMVILQKQAMVVIKNELPTIEGSATLFHQLLYNLIGNALKFSKNGNSPAIEISSSVMEIAEVDEQHLLAGHAYIRLCFKDNGIGFDQKYADKIFENYTRLHKTSEYEGTGLGLALCKRIVERHHGKITAESRLGEGALFTVMLPVAFES